MWIGPVPILAGLIKHDAQTGDWSSPFQSISNQYRIKPPSSSSCSSSSPLLPSPSWSLLPFWTLLTEIAAETYLCWNRREKPGESGETGETGFPVPIGNARAALGTNWRLSETLPNFFFFFFFSLFFFFLSRESLKSSSQMCSKILGRPTKFRWPFHSGGDLNFTSAPGKDLIVPLTPSSSSSASSSVGEEEELHWDLLH